MVLLLFPFCLSLEASPVQHPRRSINSYSIDLNPLFKWWSKHEGPRPLSSWVHITGSIVGTNAGAWIIEAQVEGARARAGSEADKNAVASAHDSLKILLQNPPMDDLIEFEQLSARLNELTIQRASLAGQESQARMHEEAVAGQQRVNRRNSIEARLLAVEDKQLKQTESAAQAEQKNLDQEIKELKAKLAIYPNTDHYAVDCFALDLQYDYGRLAVYDHGRVLK